MECSPGRVVFCLWLSLFCHYIASSLLNSWLPSVLVTSKYKCLLNNCEWNFFHSNHRIPLRRYMYAYLFLYLRGALDTMLSSLCVRHWAIIYLEEVLGMKECRQKHGGFSRLLTPEWRHWSQILMVITTEQGSFWARYHFPIPLIFAKIFVLEFASAFAFSSTF